MKTEEILNLDCRKENQKALLCKFLKKIPYAEGQSKIFRVKDLEDIIYNMCVWEGYRLQSIETIYSTESFRYVAGIKDVNGNRWVGNTYGLTLWELLAKGIVKIYADMREKEKNEENIV